jgi:hypothetical protein
MTQLSPGSGRLRGVDLDDRGRPGQPAAAPGLAVFLAEVGDDGVAGAAGQHLGPDGGRRRGHAEDQRTGAQDTFVHDGLHRTRRAGPPETIRSGDPYADQTVNASHSRPPLKERYCSLIDRAEYRPNVARSSREPEARGRPWPATGVGGLPERPRG